MLALACANWVHALLDSLPRKPLLSLPHAARFGFDFFEPVSTQRQLSDGTRISDAGLLPLR